MKLETHETKDIDGKNINGELTVVWRDWDNIINEPKMIYITDVEPGKIKGPHLHKKRTSYFLCIKGKIAFVIKDVDGKYKEIISSENEPVLIQVPKNMASGHINISAEKSSVLVLADIAWKPNDNEMLNINFDNYDWGKWKTKSSFDS